jgi:uncharacterized protein YegJ (DUF2314 family)
MRAQPALLELLKLAIATAGVGLAAGATFAEAAGNVVQRAGQPEVFLVPAEDARMNAAIAEARRTVDEFITAFASPTARQRSFAVRVPVIDGALVEDFWIDVDNFANGQFTGRIANNPLQVRNVHFGDRVVVDKERISDWLFVDRGRLMGGYTIRAVRERMTEEERKAFDASLPFAIMD